MRETLIAEKIATYMMYDFCMKTVLPISFHFVVHLYSRKTTVTEGNTKSELVYLYYVSKTIAQAQDLLYTYQDTL